MYTPEQKVGIQSIKQMPPVELAQSVDTAVELHDLELVDLMWPQERIHPMTGWVRAETVAEVIIRGTTYGEAYIDYLAKLELCRPRAEWDHPDELSGWPQRNHLPLAVSNFIAIKFLEEFNVFYANQAITGALVKLRRNTGWVENLKDYGWRLTPAGIEIVDAILEEVVELEID